MEDWQKKQDYLRDFFEHAPIGFHAFGPDRVIVDINQTELQMLGYTREEVVGQKIWTDFIIPEEVELFEQHWQEILRCGEVQNLNYTMVCKDGSRRNVLLNASARFDNKGKLVNTRGSVVDITQRYQMAHMISDSRQKLSRYRAARVKNNRILLSWLDQWQQEKFKFHRTIQKNLEDTVFPLIEKLKRHGTAIDKRNLVLIEEYLNDLTGDFSVKLMDKKWRLSAREIEICKMLKNGLKSKDIAELLFTSQRTVEHHRNHIRKKLGVPADADLSEYLKNFSL